MRWHTFESLVRVLAAGVFAYGGYQMLLGHNPFRSGPPSPLLAPLFLGIAAYQLFQAWKARRSIAGRQVEEALEQYRDGTPVAAPAGEPALEQRFVTLEQELQEEMTRLRIAAATDPKAAMTLRTRLRKQLAESTAAVHEYKRHLGSDPRLPQFLEELDKRHEAIRLELADLEQRIKLLQYKG